MLSHTTRRGVMHDQNEADLFLLKHNMGSRRPENPDLKEERKKEMYV